MSDSITPVKPVISIRWHGEYTGDRHYGYIRDVLFYTISKESIGIYHVTGLPSPVPHIADSLESSKLACDVNFKSFLSQSGLAEKS